MTAVHYEGALQDVWPEATCYGCGPANEQGLRIKSYWDPDGVHVICRFRPGPQHNAGFPNVTYGGLVASLIDCHSIWTAIATAYQAEGRPHGSAPAISYVTGSLLVRYLAPTPLDQEVVLRAHVTESRGRKSTVICSLQAGDQVTAEGIVVAVRIADDKSRGADHHA
ncbi:MAG TPA: hotdog domain-containing protein [Chloroflexia bacterium]|nr:hotdog domain-containing protein [Chloroflexia bacterium]